MNMGEKENKKKQKISELKRKEIFFSTLGISAVEDTATGCPCGQNSQRDFVAYVDMDIQSYNS